MLLSYESGGLKLTVGTSNGMSPVFDENQCGQDPQTGITNQSAMSWPAMPPLERAQYFGIGEIVGHETRDRAQTPRRRTSANRRRSGAKFQGPPPLKGNQVETAFNKATVRLIRRGGG